MLVQLFIMYYIVITSQGTSKIFVSILAFGINSGAYVAEVVRSGIQSIDKGQMEAGRSLGLNRTQTMVKIDVYKRQRIMCVQSKAVWALQRQQETMQLL